MFVQNSYIDDEGGRLYIVPTPIGNLEDMTYRAVRLLKEVDLIAAEDTRHTKKLMNHFGITNEMISYHEHNRQERIPYLLEKLALGKQIALVSDAGTPAISDPGYELVVAAVEARYSVVVLPGANAAISALVGSSLPTDEFLFVGFLPRKKREKEAMLQRLKHKQATIIVYESPYRIADTLKLLRNSFGERRVALARELTKMYEQFVRGSLVDVIEWIEKNELRGECVLIIEGAQRGVVTSDIAWWTDLSLTEHVTHYEEKESLSHKEAMRAVAQDRNISRRDVYNALHVK